MPDHYHLIAGTGATVGSFLTGITVKSCHWQAGKRAAVSAHPGWGIARGGFDDHYFPAFHQVEWPATGGDLSFPVTVTFPFRQFEPRLEEFSRDSPNRADKAA